MKNSFLQEGYDQSAYESAILAYLKSQKNGVTLADIVVNTALNTAWTEYTLRQMLGKYTAHLEINQKHEILYLFDLTPKPTPILKYILQGIGWIFWSIWWVFTIAFKALIVGMLLTYGVFYALVVVFILEAITRSGEIFWEVLKGFWYGAGELIQILSGRGNVSGTDKHILTDIFSYVFGATKAKKNALATEKLILQQIRAQGGKLMPSDIVRLTGWDLIDAQTQAAYLLANYEGEPVVTEAGKIVYHFPNLAKDDEITTLPPAIWEQTPDMPKMNNLDKEMHNIVTGLNIFNMVMSIIVLPLTIMFTFPELNGNLPEWVIIWLMFVPFVFSFLFLFIPLCRYPFFRIEKAKAQKAYHRLLVLGQIYKQLPTPVSSTRDLTSMVKETQIPQEAITELIERLHTEMRAEALANADGVVYDFKELA